MTEISWKARDGAGKLFSMRGELIFEGEFLANLREGQGIEYNEDGFKLYEEPGKKTSVKVRETLRFPAETRFRWSLYQG